MKREEIIQILRELKQLAGRVANSGPFDVHVYLGRFLDYIDNCTILKEYVSHCKLEIPEEQVGIKLKEFLDSFGHEPLFLSSSSEGEVAFLYRVFTLVRDDIDTIRMIGHCLCHINDGTVMIASFSDKLVLPFYDAIENYFNRHIEEIVSSDSVTSEVNYNILDSLIKEIDNLYVCVDFTAPLLVKWRFKAEQKLSAIYGSESDEVRWFRESAFPAPGAGRGMLAETLGMLQREFTKMKNRFMPNETKEAGRGNRIAVDSKYAYDVFVSHANANKGEFVNALEMALQRLGISIWYDANKIDWGDNWKLQIKNGLAKCRFGIVVISPEFLGREWTDKELNELLQRQDSTGQKVVLPLLYNITVEKMKEQYPQLTDFQARVVSPTDSVEDVVIDFARILIRALKSEKV